MTHERARKQGELGSPWCPSGDNRVLWTSANVVHPFKIGSMHAAHPAQARALVNVTVKSELAGEIVGLLCSIRSGSYLFNAF